MAKEWKNKDRILNCVRSKDVLKDWEYDHAVRAKILKVARAVPDTVDLREKWWEIGDQEDTGSCVGWASTDGVYRWHGVKAKKITAREHLSVRMTWMGAKETDTFRERPTGFLEQEGTSLKAALDMARKYGVVTDEMLPFKPSVMSKEDPDAFYARAAEFRISSYFNLRKGSSTWKSTITRWKNWLAGGGGPILTALDVDDTWYEADKTGGNLDVYHADSTYGGHAVVIVGYTPDRFIIRNSWGESWGDKGFGYASYDYADPAFFEAYGVRL